MPVNIDPLFRGVKKEERRREGEEGIVTMVRHFRDFEKFADSF